MNMDDYKSGFDAGKVAGKMDAILESCNHNVAMRNARWAAARKALEEVKAEINDIYTLASYCIDEIVCDYTEMDCKKCLYDGITKAIDKRLEELNDKD